MSKTFPTYIEAQKTVQEVGIKTMKEYKSCYKKLGLPSAPDYQYKDVGWISCHSFFGTFPTYEEAQKIVQKAGIKDSSDYKSCHKKLGLPSSPNKTYKKEGWTSWMDFLGRSYPSYEEARIILKDHGIQSIPEYRACYNKLGLHSAPDLHYKGKGWISWYDFFGKEDVPFPSYTEACGIVQSNGIKSIKEYKASYKALGLPSAPEGHYKDMGWTSWPDFFCRPSRITSKDRKYNILKKLAITPALLKDDAPLQVIYIFVSQFNKELAKEIETLLGTSSYEERLNWVKEQLKGLKDGSSSKTKTSDETSIDGLSALVSSEDENEDSTDEVHTEGFSEDGLEEDTDELSAIESIVEENKDVIDSLSEEKLERLNIIYENYVHSVVNRELIAENDDKGLK